MTPAVIAIIMVIMFVGIIILDVYLAVDKVPDNTYSANLRLLAKYWPPSRLIVVFGMGMLAGHLYW
jgi:hypothetical protein